MTKQLPKVDVVLVGFGWTGAIYAEKLTAAGMEVLALERGPWRDTPKDFATTFAQDELRYYWRHGMFQEASQSTVTFRNNGAQTALPMRHWGSFLPATEWAARACIGTARLTVSCHRISSRKAITRNAMARCPRG